MTIQEQNDRAREEQIARQKMYEKQARRERLVWPNHIHVELGDDGAKQITVHTPGGRVFRCQSVTIMPHGVAFVTREKRRSCFYPMVGIGHVDIKYTEDED